MPRQPLMRRFANPSLSLGPGFLAERPEAAAVIAQCIATWAEVDIQVARLLAAMLGTSQSEPAMALYDALKNERAKNEALNAISVFCFEPDEIIIFQTIMRARWSLAKERHDLAHGLFVSFPRKAKALLG